MTFNRHEMGIIGFYSRKADSIAKVWMGNKQDEGMCKEKMRRELKQSV